MANSALSSNVVKTALDKVFMQTWNEGALPGLVTVADSKVFNQFTSDKAAEIHEVFRGSGYWEQKGESENAAAGQSRTVNQVTYVNTTFAKSEDVPKDFFDDDQHSMVQKLVQEMAREGKATQNLKGFLTYNRAFNASYTGGDGQPLIDTDHPIATGTQSNEVASNPELTPTSLNTAIVQLLQMKKQSGTPGMCAPKTLFVPPALYKYAVEITESKGLADTADNNMNVYSSKYGIYVAQSVFISAAYGGSDTAWFLLSDNHAINRFVRENINTTIIDWKQTRNHNYIYTGRYRESTGWDDYVGIVGSDGTNV